MARTVSLLAELLESVLQENRELLLELNVGTVISASRRENPAIAELDVGPDLHVNAGKIADEPMSHVALASIIFTIKEFMEVFVGLAESEARIGKAVAHFAGKHDNSTLAPISEMFPALFSAGRPDQGTSLENLDDIEKVRRIFIDLLKSAASRSSGEASAAILPYLRQSPSIKSVSDDLSQLEYSFGLTVEEAIDLFSDAVERNGIPHGIVKDVLAGYGSIPAELGISAGLLGGALSDTTAFGCASVDKLLRDGIKRDDTLVLEGPAGVEKEILALAFIREALRNNGCAIVVNSICPVRRIRRQLESSGLDMAAIEAEGRIIYVDWHSRFTERITSIDVSGPEIKVSNDLTNLAVGIDMALRKADLFPQARMVMEMVSPTIVTEGFDTVHDFLNSIRAKLKNHSCTGLILVNPIMHSVEQNGMLEDTFDGTLCIERAEEHGRISSTFRVSHLSGGAFSGARLGMAVTHRGLEISGSDGTQPEVMPFDAGAEKAIMGLLGIESLSPNGLPMGNTFLVWMPSSMMPADYVKPFVMDAQKEGHALLLSLSSLGTDTIGEWVSEMGLSRKGLIDRGLLQVVDWHSQRSMKVLGMEVDEGIIRTSRDMTHLGVGIDLALRKMNEQFSSMAITEVLSPALRLFDIRTVYPFAQSINAKLGKRGFTAFMLMERDAHESTVNAAMEELFDGILDIRSAGGALEIGIISLRGCHFQSEYRALTKMRDRLTVDVSRRIPDSEIIDSIAGHGLSAKLKRLEKELDQTLEEKQALERKLKELSDREAEYDRRHSEMEFAMQQVEARLKEQSEDPAAEFQGVDALHREEMARLLKIMDDMLENLPEEVIDSFARSDDFKLYEKILGLYLEEKK